MFAGDNLLTLDVPTHTHALGMIVEHMFNACFASLPMHARTGPQFVCHCSNGRDFRDI